MRFTRLYSWIWTLIRNKTIWYDNLKLTYKTGCQTWKNQIASLEQCFQDSRRRGWITPPTTRTAWALSWFPCIPVYFAIKWGCSNEVFDKFCASNLSVIKTNLGRKNRWVSVRRWFHPLLTLSWGEFVVFSIKSSDAIDDLIDLFIVASREQQFTY